MPSRVLVVTAAFFIVVFAFAPSGASAQRRQRRPRTPVSDAAPAGVAAGIGLMGAGAMLYMSTPEQAPQQQAGVWRGGLGGDDIVRGNMRATSGRGQEGAMNISDLLMVATILNAGIVDSVIAPLVQGDPDLAWQASAAHATALGLTLTLGGAVKMLVSRARPYESECRNGQGEGCNDGDIYQSFYSLHTGVAFTEAGFSCAMHMSRNLYGDEGTDALACGASLALAATTGAMRVVADRHYLTDVLIGAVLGFAVGYVVPLLLVPSRAEPDPDEEDSSFTWSAVPTFSMSETEGTSIGVAISGTF